VIVIQEEKRFLGRGWELCGIGGWDTVLIILRLLLRQKNGRQ
jgi:hypothetical protein